MKILSFLVSVTITLTLTPAHSQPTALASTDSLQIPTLSPQKYDFYYSARQADAVTKSSIASYVSEDRLTRNRFLDKTYTAFVAKGLPMQDGFDDYILIGSGTIEEIKPDGYW